MDLAQNSTDKTESMSALQAIYFRRAVRQYTDRKVNAAVISELLDAATQAPSAMNSQPWSFIVIQDEKLLKEISEKAKQFLAQNIHWARASEHSRKPFMDPSFDIFYGATTLVIICAEKNDHAAFSPLEDCYLAGENLMIAACAMGLGTCPIGFARDVLKQGEFVKRLAIPPNFVPVLPIIIGYPKGFTSPAPRHPVRVLSWIRPRS